MMLMCVITILLDIRGVSTPSEEDVTGRLIVNYNKVYLMDFSDGVKKFNVVDSPQNYSRVVVSAKNCVKN